MKSAARAPEMPIDPNAEGTVAEEKTKPETFSLGAVQIVRQLSSIIDEELSAFANIVPGSSIIPVYDIILQNQLVFQPADLFFYLQTNERN